jgi:hypothetical protein
VLEICSEPSCGTPLLRRSFGRTFEPGAWRVYRDTTFAPGERRTFHLPRPAAASHWRLRYDLVDPAHVSDLPPEEATLIVWEGAL